MNIVQTLSTLTSCRFLVLIYACQAKSGSEGPPGQAQATEEDSKCGRSNRGRSGDHHTTAGEERNNAIVNLHQTLMLFRIGNSNSRD